MPKSPAQDAGGRFRKTSRPTLAIKSGGGTPPRQPAGRRRYGREAELRILVLLSPCSAAILGGCGAGVSSAYVVRRSLHHDSSDGSSRLLSRIESGASLTGDEIT